MDDVVFAHFIHKIFTNLDPHFQLASSGKCLLDQLLITITRLIGHHCKIITENKTLRIKHVNFVLAELFTQDELLQYGLEKSKLFDIESDLTREEEIEARNKLIIPPIRIYKIMKSYISKISISSILYLTAFLQYFITEIIISSMTVSELHKKIKVTGTHVLIALDLDEELYDFIQRNNIILLINHKLLVNERYFNKNWKNTISQKYTTIPFIMSQETKMIVQQLSENEIIKWVDKAVNFRDYESRETLTFFDLLVTSDDVLFVNDWLDIFKYSNISHDQIFDILEKELLLSNIDDGLLYNFNCKISDDAIKLLALSLVYISYMLLVESYKISLLTKKNSVVRTSITINDIRKTLSLKNYWLVIC